MLYLFRHCKGRLSAFQLVIWKVTSTGWFFYAFPSVWTTQVELIHNDFPAWSYKFHFCLSLIVNNVHESYFLFLPKMCIIIVTRYWLCIYFFILKLEQKGWYGCLLLYSIRFTFVLQFLLSADLYSHQWLLSATWPSYLYLWFFIWRSFCSLTIKTILFQEYNKHDKEPAKYIKQWTGVKPKTGAQYSCDIGYERFLGPEVCMDMPYYSFLALSILFHGQWSEKILLSSEINVLSCNVWLYQWTYMMVIPFWNGA